MQDDDIPAPRIPVSLTMGERREIEAAMQRAGYRSMTEFIRVAALREARRVTDDKV